MDITPIIKASIQIDNGRTEKEIALYLSSEAGEVADWLLNPQKRKEALHGECADVIICAVDLAIQHAINQFPDADPELVAGMAISSLETQIRTKSEKWRGKSDGSIR